MCKKVQTQNVTEWKTKDRWHSCKQISYNEPDSFLLHIIHWGRDEMKPLILLLFLAMKPLILRWIPSSFFARGLDLDQVAKILTMRPSTVIPRTKLVLYRNSIFIAEACCWGSRRNRIDIMNIPLNILLRWRVRLYDGWHTSISMFPFN